MAGAGGDDDDLAGFEGFESHRDDVSGRQELQAMSQIEGLGLSPLMILVAQHDLMRESGVQHRSRKGGTDGSGSDDADAIHRHGVSRLVFIRPLREPVDAFMDSG